MYLLPRSILRSVLIINFKMVQCISFLSWSYSVSCINQICMHYVTTKQARLLRMGRRLWTKKNNHLKFWRTHSNRLNMIFYYTCNTKLWVADEHTKYPSWTTERMCVIRPSLAWMTSSLYKGFDVVFSF